MSLLNLPLGGLVGGLSNSPPTAIAGESIALSRNGNGATTNRSTLATSARDSMISELSDTSSSVNALQQAASSQVSDSSDEPLLTLPPLPPMPTPKAPAAVPTDDHGQSNVVFSDADADGALIH